MLLAICDIYSKSFNKKDLYNSKKVDWTTLDETITTIVDGVIAVIGAGEYT